MLNVIQESGVICSVAKSASFNPISFFICTLIEGIYHSGRQYLMLACNGNFVSLCLLCLAAVTCSVNAHM